MNLKQWRLAREMTMAEAAAHFEIESARTYQRYESGENRPDAPIMERFRMLSDGQVTVDAMHDQRLEWLRSNRPDALAGPSAASMDCGGSG